MAFCTNFHVCEKTVGSSRRSTPSLVVMFDVEHLCIDPFFMRTDGNALQVGTRVRCETAR